MESSGEILDSDNEEIEQMATARSTLEELKEEIIDIFDMTEQEWEDFDNFNEKKDPIKLVNPEIEANYNKLIIRNAQLAKELKQEKNKWELMKPEFDFLQDKYNEYIDLKNSEEIEDNKKKVGFGIPVAIQTTESIICKQCLDVLEITESYSYKEFQKHQADGSYILSKEEYKSIIDGFQHLKKSINQREVTSYETRSDQVEIIQLKHKNHKLLHETYELRAQSDKQENIIRTLQTIIMKMTQNENHQKYLTPFEQLWVHQICTNTDDIQSQISKYDSENTYPSVSEF